MALVISNQYQFKIVKNTNLQLHLSKGLQWINRTCYIASVNTKRDWLICSHVALDKCNVSRPGNK